MNLDIVLVQDIVLDMALDFLAVDIGLDLPGRLVVDIALGIAPR